MLIRLTAVLAIVAGFILSACSVQKTYFDADMASGNGEARSGNLTKAVEHYRAALWRAKNHLDAAEISSAYYNLGKTLRQQGRFEQSVEALFESINYAAKAGTFDALATGRRHVEIAASYAGLGRWKTGAPYVKRLVSIHDEYSGQEAEFVRILFREYKKNLTELGEDATFIP